MHLENNHFPFTNLRNIFKKTIIHCSNGKKINVIRAEGNIPEEKYRGHVNRKNEGFALKKKTKI